jgi:hypothetical protein
MEESADIAWDIKSPEDSNKGFMESVMKTMLSWL